MAPLDGARLKVVRAQEHLDCLKVAIAEYEKRDPYIVTIGDDPGYTGASADITEHPEMRLSAIIGDCLHNLNSALDYVMWEIAGTYAQRVLVPKKDTPYFPIFDIPDNFDEYVARLNNPKKWNYKIPDPVISEFRSVQPYQTGYWPLALFKILVNVDKHRLPLVAKGEIKSFEIAVTRPAFSAEFPHVIGINPIHYKTTVETQATIYVTWQDPFMPREPVMRTLQDFVELVANIIPRFDRFVV